MNIGSSINTFPPSESLHCNAAANITEQPVPVAQEATIIQKPKPKLQSRILCPLCPDNSKVRLKTYSLLTKHISDVHDITVKETKINFATKEDFSNWMSLDKKETNYVKQRTSLRPMYSCVDYCCNRSNTAGFTSKSSKRLCKAGGTIKINGVCPSKITATIFFNGEVHVKFVETHIGHTNELRAQHLTKKEQEDIANKLKSGVSTETILKDARKLKNNEIERINLLNRSDLKYLKKKFNIIDKRRNSDDMVAAEVKVEELNENDTEEDKSIEEPLEKKIILQEAFEEFVEEKPCMVNKTEEMDERTQTETLIEEYIRRIKQLDDNQIRRYINETLPTLRKYEELSKNAERKMDHQTYYPQKKPKNLF